ncbi:MAG: DinB family protein [Blastocatellia bacterium]
MNKQQLLEKWGYFNLVHGVTVRLIGCFTDADLDFRPQPGMRSVRELFAHFYAMERVLAENVGSGKITQEVENVVISESDAGRELLARLPTVTDLQQYANDCHAAAAAAVEKLTDEDLARPVEAPYGTFPGAQFFTFAYDEHWHHRGQLYVYARLLGKEPPMLYDYQ